MQKPDKIFLDNPNLLYALASHPVKIGTARETFVVNQLSCDNEVEYGKKTGDFRSMEDIFWKLVVKVKRMIRLQMCLILIF